MAESSSLASSLTETSVEQKASAAEADAAPALEVTDSSDNYQEDTAASTPSDGTKSPLNSPLYQAILAFGLRRKERENEADYSDSDYDSSLHNSDSNMSLDSKTKNHKDAAGPTQHAMYETTLESSAVGGIVLWACMMGHVPMLQQLFQSYHVQMGARLADYADYDQRTALHLAAAGGQEAVCKYLLEEARVKVNPVDRWGHSPLDDAERFGRKTGRWTCHDMLKTKYDARPGPGNEETAMIKAAFHGDHKSVLRYAQARHLQGKEVNPADYDDRTPLHLAASQGHYKVVEVLLGQGVGASPDIQDRWNRRPLDDAQDGLQKYTQIQADASKAENFEMCVDLLRSYHTSPTTRCFSCRQVKPDRKKEVKYQDDAQTTEIKSFKEGFHPIKMGPRKKKVAPKKRLDR